MKTIIAIWHSSQKGKTQTIKELAHILIANYKYTPVIPVSIPSSGDIRVIIKVNGKVICLESQGDPKTQLKKRLNEICKLYNPDIIICSTRTRGETVDAVEDIAKSQKYNLIWTSTYQTSQASQQNTLNQLKAQHLHNLLSSLSLI